MIMQDCSQPKLSLAGWLVILAIAIVIAIIKAIFWLAVIALAAAAVFVAWRRWGKPAVGSVT